MLTNLALIYLSATRPLLSSAVLGPAGTAASSRRPRRSSHTTSTTPPVTNSRQTTPPTQAPDAAPTKMPASASGTGSGHLAAVTKAVFQQFLDVVPVELLREAHDHR